MVFLAVFFVGIFFFLKAFISIVGECDGKISSSLFDRFFFGEDDFIFGDDEELGITIFTCVLSPKLPLCFFEMDMRISVSALVFGSRLPVEVSSSALVCLRCLRLVTEPFSDIFGFLRIYKW